MNKHTYEFFQVVNAWVQNLKWYTNVYMWKSLSTPRHIDKHLLVSYVCTLLVLKKKNSVINTDGYIWERLVLGFSLEVVGLPHPRGGLKKLKFYFMSPAPALWVFPWPEVFRGDLGPQSSQCSASFSWAGPKFPGLGMNALFQWNTPVYWDWEILGSAEFSHASHSSRFSWAEVNPVGLLFL